VSGCWFPLTCVAGTRELHESPAELEIGLELRIVLAHEHIAKEHTKGDRPWDTSQAQNPEELRSTLDTYD